MKCPYCKSDVNLVDSYLIYRRSYGRAWLCSQFPKCDSYVGCHPGTDKPLGRLANAELRKAKMEAHKAFDALWKRKMERDKCSQRVARSAGYKWLAQQLSIEINECHIAMFDLDKCKKVLEVCK